MKKKKKKKKIKHFEDFKLPKHLAESLVLSKLFYCDTVLNPLPDFLLKRIQRVQFSAASFVTGNYVNDNYTIYKLGWIPIKQQRQYNQLKLVHKAIYNAEWPSLSLDIVQNARCLRSSNAIRLVTPLEKGTFQVTSANLFNELPPSIRQCKDFTTFVRFLKIHLDSSRDT